MPSPAPRRRSLRALAALVAVSVLAALGLSPETGAAQPDGDVLLAALATPGFQSEAGAGQPAAEDIVAALVKAGVRVRGFAVERESLEDRFVELTGEGFDVAQ